MAITVRGGVGGVVAATFFCVASVVLVAALPQLLGYPFSNFNSILVGQGVLCTIGVVFVFVMRLFPENVTRVAHTVVMWVLVWIPFFYFLMDDISTVTVVAPDTNVVLGTISFLFGAASMNLVRKELAYASSILVMWIASMAFVAHLCLAWNWKFTGEKSFVFWLVFTAVLLVLVVVSLTMVTFPRCWTSISKMLGVRWYTMFHRWRITAVVVETLAVLSLSQSTSGSGARSVLVPVVAMFFAVFWGLMFLNATVRLGSRFLGLVPLPAVVRKAPKTPVLKTWLVVGGVVVWSVTTRVSSLEAGWVALVAIVAAVVCAVPVARQELVRQKTSAGDLVLAGFCATLACETPLVRVTPWFSAAIIGLILIVAVRFFQMRSYIIAATQLSLATAALVSVFVETTMHMPTMLSIVVLGLAAIPWTVVWGFVGVRDLLRGRKKQKQISVVMVGGFVLLLAMFLGLVLFSAAVGLNPPSSTELVYYEMSFVALVIGMLMVVAGLVLYYRCVVVPAQKQKQNQNENEP